MGVSAASAVGQSAVRDLPGQYLPGTPTVSVSITLNAGGAAAVGLEDRPPVGWSVSNISHSGALDVQSGKIKWGPFFSGSIPPAVSYDAHPQLGVTQSCFVGTASFDGLNHTIAGDACAIQIPAASTWGLLTLTLLVSTSATLVIAARTRPKISLDQR
jgi:hypothetical protein